MNKILVEKFGKGLDLNKKKKMIDKIIKRGKLKTDEEFRIIDERANELSQTDPSSTEIDILNKILLDYHKRKSNIS